jgi:hypothetical protein
MVNEEADIAADLIEVDKLIDESVQIRKSNLILNVTVPQTSISGAKRRKTTTSCQEGISGGDG